MNSRVRGLALPRSCPGRASVSALAARCAATALALAATSTPPHAGAADAIPWERARDHVGRRIVVEGVVASTRRIDAGCVLLFSDAADPDFSVTLMIPLFSRGPDRPEAYYLGKRVQVTGLVRQLPGHAPEIIVHNPGNIAVVTTADAGAPAPGAGTRPAAAAGPETVAGPIDAPRPAATDAGTPAGGAGQAGQANVAAGRPGQQVARCEGARTRWRNVGGRVENALAAMSGCLRAERYRCRAEAEALYAAMAELAAAEGAVEASCP